MGLIIDLYILSFVFLWMSFDLKILDASKYALLAWTTPVSYTHLDVYKRQVYVCLFEHTRAMHAQACVWLNII